MVIAFVVGATVLASEQNSVIDVPLNTTGFGLESPRELSGRSRYNGRCEMRSVD